MDKYFETDDDYVYMFEDEERLGVLYELLKHPKTENNEFIHDLQDSLHEFEKLTGPQYNALVRLYKRFVK